VWGYFLHDEPRAKDFPALARAVAAVRSQHPDALSFINLLGTANFSAAEAKALYGVPTYEEYVDSFIATVKPDILSYDCYPEYASMDNLHYNAGFMRNKSLHAGIPLWNYIWLEANGRGHGAGFYRWQLFVSAAYGSRGIMQWSLSPCGNIHACGPKDRWAPFPCLLDKHGQLFKPVASMARAEHRRLLAMGPLLIQMDSLQVQRHKPSRAAPIIRVAGMPLRSITGGAWLLGHFRSPRQGECVMVVNDDPINTAFPSIDLGAAAAVREVDQESGALVAVEDEAPDVAGFQLFWDEGGGRLFCWGNSTAGGHGQRVKTDDEARAPPQQLPDGGGVAIHNRSDCCCVNLPDRSARNLVDTVEECVASCAAASGCHAAVLLEGPAAGNCHAKVPPGKKCCLHKGHFDTMHHAGGRGTSTVIDMGTSSGPCPSHPPKPPPSPSPPSPSPPSPALSGRPTYHYTRLSGEMNDPNGLQWTRLPDGTVEYHMVHLLSTLSQPQRTLTRAPRLCAVPPAR
jgi:hypothetical protein